MMRVFINNKWIFNQFWEYKNGHLSDDDWKKEFNKQNRIAQRSIITNPSVFWSILFGRLYTLRNQLMHGAATKGSSINRDQVEDGSKILNKVLPILVNILMIYPNENWENLIIDPLIGILKIKYESDNLPISIYGTLSTNGNGYGFIKTSSGRDYFAHISNLENSKSKNIEDFNYRLCGGILGGNAFRYSKNNENWNNSIVKWILINNDDDLNALTYQDLRKKQLNGLDINKVKSLLTSKWYFESWRKYTNSLPKSKLFADDILEDSLLAMLKKVKI